MKHMKRLLSLALAAALSLSLLSGCGGSPSASSSESSGSQGDSSSTQEPIDLASITDPFLTTAGMSGDTVIGTVGDEELTAAELLYWISYTADSMLSYAAMLGGSDLPWDTEIEEGVTMADGIKSAALETTALYALIPKIAQQEQLSVSPEVEAEYTSALEEVTQELGSEEYLTHYLWQVPITKEIYLDSCLVQELGYLIQDAYYGENSGNYPTDQQVLDYMGELGYYQAKHILLKTVNTDETVTNEDGSVSYAPLDDATIAEKEALAQDLVRQLEESDDPEALFDSFMVEYSEDVDSTGAPNSPEGYIAQYGQMVSAFDEAIQSVEPGNFSQPYRSDEYGFHIVYRVPLTMSEDYRSQYVNAKMIERQEEWLEANPIQTNENYDKLDVPAFYEKLTALREVVNAELNALDSAESGDASSSGASSTTTASSSSSQG